MHFSSPLTPATLALRSKRFLADVIFDSGEMVTAHVSDPGAMPNLDRPFSPVWLSDSDNPLRTSRYTWELVEVDLGSGPELVGVNPAHPNVLVGETLAQGLIPELRGYTSIQRDVKYGTESRADFLLECVGKPPCYMDVKNVHLMRKPRLAEFPDGPTPRGAAHLDELAAVRGRGARAVVLFVIQIPSAERFAIARDIDAAYAEAYDKARAKGVEMLAWRCAVEVEGIHIADPVPIVG